MRAEQAEGDSSVTNRICTGWKLAVSKEGRGCEGGLPCGVSVVDEEYTVGRRHSYQEAGYRRSAGFP